MESGLIDRSGFPALPPPTKVASEVSVAFKADLQEVKQEVKPSSNTSPVAKTPLATAPNPSTTAPLQNSRSIQPNAHPSSGAYTPSLPERPNQLSVTPTPSIDALSPVPPPAAFFSWYRPFLFSDAQQMLPFYVRDTPQGIELTLSLFALDITNVQSTSRYFIVSLARSNELTQAHTSTVPSLMPNILFFFSPPGFTETIKSEVNGSTLRIYITRET